MKKRSGRRHVVVIDTTLLCRLLHTDLPAKLPLLFDAVHIPEEVLREVGRGPQRMGRRVQKLMRRAPRFWVRCTEQDDALFRLFRAELDAGESCVLAQADALGQRMKTSAIVDERRGHRVGSNMQIRMLRTGGLLVMLKEAGIILNVDFYLDALIRHGFSLSLRARNDILSKAGEPLHAAP